MRFKEIFHGERFAELKEAGAPVQRPLWASTGVKNPNFPDTLYVDDLVAPETVNTMPMPTLLAAGEKAEIKGATADADPAEVEAAMKELEDAGIDMEQVVEELLDEGVELFDRRDGQADRGRRERARGGGHRPPGHVREQHPRRARARARRAREAGRRGGRGAARVGEGRDALGRRRRAGARRPPRLADDLATRCSSSARDLRAFAQACREDGLTDAVLLGMGGSSLGPEVIRRSFGDGTDGMRLHVLDSTDPGAVLEAERAIDLKSKTLFIVSSKSGGTIETLSQFRYFHARAQEALGDEAGKHFVAITDPGTPLAELAEENGFLHTFINDPEIGGRYSRAVVLRVGARGADGRRRRRRCWSGAQVAEQVCRHDDHSSSNSGLWLGIAMGELAAAPEATSSRSWSRTRSRASACGSSS